MKAALFSLSVLRYFGRYRSQWRWGEGCPTFCGRMRWRAASRRVWQLGAQGCVPRRQRYPVRRAQVVLVPVARGESVSASERRTSGKVVYDFKLKPLGEAGRGRGRRCGWFWWRALLLKLGCSRLRVRNAPLKISGRIGGRREGGGKCNGIGPGGQTR
jgi:hypothetical protein